MNTARPWHRNLALLNATSFARAFMIVMPVFVPLMQRYGLTMKDTMILQSVFAAVTLALELPSGFIADVFGRKATLCIGYLFTGLGFSQLLWADTFWELVLFEITIGFSLSFISGSDTALAFESEKALGNTAGQPAIARLLSWMNFGEGTAALAAFVLIKYNLLWVIWAQAIVAWVPFALSIYLTEAPREQGAKTNKQSLADIKGIIVQNSTILFLTLLFTVTMSFTYLVAWLNQSLWQEAGLELKYFGLIWGLFSLTIGLAARYSTRLPDKFGRVSLLTVLAGLLFVSYLLISTDLLVTVILGGLLIGIFRGLAAPKIKLRINNLIDNQYRATINSLVGGCFRVATLILGPIMGWVVDRYSADIAANSLIILVIPAMAGLIIAGVKLKPEKVIA